MRNFNRTLSLSISAHNTISAKPLIQIFKWGSGPVIYHSNVTHQVCVLMYIQFVNIYGLHYLVPTPKENTYYMVVTIKPSSGLQGLLLLDTILLSHFPDLLYWQPKSLEIHFYNNTTYYELQHNKCTHIYQWPIRLITCF